MRQAEKKETTGLVVRERVSPDAVEAPVTDKVASAGYTPAQIDHAWKQAVSGMRSVVSFGAMLCEQEFSLTRETKLNRTVGRPTDGTLKEWLCENCPTVNYKTAMRFRRLAEITLAECGKIAPAEAVQMLACPPDQFFGTSEDEARKRDALEKFLDGKSQRDVLQAWADGGSKPGKVSGKTAAVATRQEKSPEECARELRVAAVSTLLGARNQMRAFVTDKMWQHMQPAQVRTLLKDIKADLQAIAQAAES